MSLKFGLASIAIYALSNLFSTDCFAQTLSGYVFDSENIPIPYVNVFVKRTNAGTSTDKNGHYSIDLLPGDYEIVYSFVGYTNKTIELVVKDKNLTTNVQLELSSVELNQIIVKSKRKDPAFEIIEKAVQNKKKYLFQVESTRAQVYVKAIEETDLKEKKRRKNETQESFEDVDDKTGPALPDEMLDSAAVPQVPNISLLEMEMTLNYAAPDNYKEERTAFNSYGSITALFVPRFGENDFNFYQNSIQLRGIAEVPVISPISNSAILTYKYKLLDVITEDGEVYYKIKVIPRKKGNSSVEGTILINDGLWNIRGLDFSFYKSGLRFYDAFHIKQTHTPIKDSLWFPTRQEFTYETKVGLKKTFKGNTVLAYSDYELNYQFPKNFFNNEISVTTAEAYKKDSAFWESTRPEALSVDQQRLVFYTDSIKAAHSRREYIDSMEIEYNKLTILEVLWEGMRWRDFDKKEQFGTAPLLSMAELAIIGGWRIADYVSYFKRWENGKYIWARGSASMGLRNKDWQGGASIYMGFDPMHNGSGSIRVMRSFTSINPNDAYLNQIKRSNEVLADGYSGSLRRELVNGLYLSLNIDHKHYQSVAHYKVGDWIDKYIDDNDALEFENYKTFVSNLKVWYTPAQKYVTEPDRKLIIGSVYPTFSLNHKKGWKNFLGSNVDFDFIEFEIKQELILGALGNSRYSIKSGKFINSNSINFIDLKRFRQSDPYLFSEALNSFQLLDTAIHTTNAFIEGHYIHHFNGAIMNFIPLVKNLNIRTVAGAGVVWVKDNNYQQFESFAGLERVFKLGKRRRLRIGVYGVAADSNHGAAKAAYKVSFDVIDTWNRNWNY